MAAFASGPKEGRRPKEANEKEGGEVERRRPGAPLSANPLQVMSTKPLFPNDAEVRVMPPKAATSQSAVQADVADSQLPAPGTAIVRKYKGRTLRVLVVTDGFEYEGQRDKSLSAVAKSITGSHCNSFWFFNLEDAKWPPRSREVAE